MVKRTIRSIAAVAAGVFVAVMGLVLAAPLLMFVLAPFPQAYLEAHLPTVMLSIAALGEIVVAVLAGIAIGVLSPARPALHALVAAALITGVSAGLAGGRGLPHGWQIARLLLQVMLIMAVAALAWRHWSAHASVDVHAS